MRTDHASASARIAFWAASLAPAARISTPMILPPQMTCRVLVLMARNYSATAPDVQSTTPRMTSAPRHFDLVKSAAAAPERLLGTVETEKRRVTSELPPPSRVKWPCISAALVLQQRS